MDESLPGKVRIGTTMSGHTSVALRIWKETRCGSRSFSVQGAPHCGGSGTASSKRISKPVTAGTST